MANKIVVEAAVVCKSLYHGSYKTYTPEERFKIGKYAAENGNATM